MKRASGEVFTVDVEWACDGSANSGPHPESARLAMSSLGLASGEVFHNYEPCAAMVVHNGVQAMSVECDLCPVEQIISDKAARPFLEQARRFYEGGAPDVMRVQLRHIGVANR